MLTEAPAPEVTEELSEDEKAIMSRYSHVFGTVRMFAPEDVEPAEWGNHPWRVTAERDGGKQDQAKPLDLLVKPASAMQVYNSPGLMCKAHEWDQAAVELSAMLEGEEATPPSRLRRKFE